MSTMELTRQSFLNEVLGEEGFVLVDFWAPWCGPCRMLSPTVEELAQEYSGELKVASVNVDEQPELAQEYQVMSIPTLLLFQNGQPRAASVGLKPKTALKSWLRVQGAVR